MNRKDYQLIGDQLKGVFEIINLLPKNPKTTPREVLESVVKDLCFAFKEDNDKFNPQKFLEYVGIEKK